MDEIKGLLNIIIEYYRNQKYVESKDKEFSKELFPTLLIDHKIVSICSPTSYRKLVSGESLKNDDIYLLLLQKMDLIYDEKAFVYDKEFKKRCKQILHHLEVMNYDAMQDLLQDTISLLKSNDVIEKEYKIVLSALYDMNLREKNGDSKDMPHILDLFTIYNEEIKQCLDVAVYNYCALMHYDNKISYYLSQVKNTPYHRAHVLYYLIDNNVHLDVVEAEMKALLNHYRENGNYNMMLNLLIMKMKYFYLIGKNSDDAIEEIDKFIQKYQTQICKRMIKSYLYFKAKKYNREGSYRQAKMNFEELLIMDASYITYILSYYFHCLIMLDDTIKYDEKLSEYFKGNDEILYRYFQIPQEAYVEREDYIIKKLCVDKILNQEFIVKSFLYELRKIVKVTKHYVMLDKYLEKTDVFL